MQASRIISIVDVVVKNCAFLQSTLNSCLTSRPGNTCRWKSLKKSKITKFPSPPRPPQNEETSPNNCPNILDLQVFSYFHHVWGGDLCDPPHFHFPLRGFPGPLGLRSPPVSQRSQNRPRVKKSKRRSPGESPRESTGVPAEPPNRAKNESPESKNR